MANIRIEEETDKVLRQAQKVINEANRAIAKTESYFKSRNISHDDLMKYLEIHADDDLYKNIQSMLSEAIREARLEAQIEKNSPASKNVNMKKIKKIKTLI